MANKKISGAAFHHVALLTTDLERSVKFYKALGMEEIVRWGEGAFEIVMLDIGDGGRIELFAGGGDFLSKEGKWLHFAMKVDDVDAAYATALAAGFESKIAPKVVPLASWPNPMSINIAFVVGPDGEELEFFREL